MSKWKVRMGREKVKRGSMMRKEEDLKHILGKVGDLTAEGGFVLSESDEKFNGELTEAILERVRGSDLDHRSTHETGIGLDEARVKVWEQGENREGN